MKKKFGLTSSDYSINYKKQRIELAPELLEKVASEIKEKCFIVETYPTYDELEVERYPVKS